MSYFEKLVLGFLASIVFLLMALWVNTARAAEWRGIIPAEIRWVLTEEGPPHYAWTPAECVPECHPDFYPVLYEAFACNATGDVCHHIGDFTKPELWLNQIQWWAATRKLGIPRLRVRPIVETEDGLIKGPYSELTPESIELVR